MGLLIGVGGTKPQFPYDYYYGIEWDSTVSNPVVKRIGKMELHRELPLQNMMRRCLLNDDGTVNYYLHPNDSTKRENGAAADLTGADGQYMVELPDMYVRFETEGTKHRALISTEALPGFHLWRKDYVSAVEATVQRSTGKLSSVVSMDPDYRGGDNNPIGDLTNKTLKGRPATYISLNSLRGYARKRGSTEWNCYLYQSHRKIVWLYVIEYANFNIQDVFRADVTSEGFKQGGLGVGVTNFSNWGTYNNYRPVVPCGITKSLGNKSGMVEYDILNNDNTLNFTVSVPSYRGIENPFGHLWKIVDGCRCVVRTLDTGSMTEFYVCDVPSDFTDFGITNYQLRGILPLGDGYIKDLILGYDGDIMPCRTGGGSTLYFCDTYTGAKLGTIDERMVLVSGTSVSNSGGGCFGCSTLDYQTTQNVVYGSRLCFYPNK